MEPPLSNILNKMLGDARKRLKLSLCPRSHWVENDSVTECGRCSKHFVFLIRRRHHCRGCGNIFCDECSDHRLLGSEFNEGNQQIRFCELCFRKYQRYLKQHNSSFTHSPQDVFKSSSPIREKSVSKEELKLIQESNMSEQQKLVSTKQMRQNVVDKIYLLTQIAFKENKIPFSYFQYVTSLVLTVVRDVPPNAIVTKSMNIHKHIKFSKIKHEDSSASKYIVGTVVKLSLNSKIKHLSKHHNPKVILMYGGMEIGDLVDNPDKCQSKPARIKVFNKVLEDLLDLRVDVLFLEKSIHHELEEQLFDYNVTVFDEVDVTAITKIQYSLEIKKVVESYRTLRKEKMEVISGWSKLIYFEQFLKYDDIYHFVIIIEGNKPYRGLTIATSAPSKDLNRRIISTIKILLAIGRHLFLKMYAIMLDQKMLQSLTISYQKSKEHFPDIFFKMFHNLHINTYLYLRLTHLTYKKIVFVQSDYSVFEEIPKDDYYYLKHKLSRRFYPKWDEFTEVCPSSNMAIEWSRRYYSEDDWPFGDYLLRKLVNPHKKCPLCHLPGYKHIDVFYNSAFYVKVQVDSRVTEHKSTLNKKDSSSDEDHFFQQLSNFRSEHKFENFIECADCRKQLSKKFFVSKEQMEFSLVAFLTNLLYPTNHSRIKGVNRSTGKNGGCKHERMCRVYQYGDTLLRTYTDYLLLAPLFKMSSSTITQHKKHKQLVQLKELHSDHDLKLERVFGLILHQIKSLKGFYGDDEFSQMLQQPRALALKTKSSFSGSSSITEHQLICILLPEILSKLHVIKVEYEEIFSTNNLVETIFFFKTAINILRRVSALLTQVRSKNEHKTKNKMVEFQQGIENYQEFEDEQERTAEISHSFISESTMLEPSKSGEFEKTEQKAVDEIFKLNYCTLKDDRVFLKKLLASPHEPPTLISMALNSLSHKEVFEGSESPMEVLKVKYSDEGDLGDFGLSPEMRKIHNFVQTNERILGVDSPSPKHSRQVHILHPRLFEQIREVSGINSQEFIESIYCSRPWNTTGGKSGTSFWKAPNDLLIVKRISDREFNTLQKITPGYIKHVLEGTLLTRIYGGFRIARSLKSDCYIVMENLFFGMNNCQLYDFKGSKVKRYSKPPVIPLDINYFIDRNSEPLMSAFNVLEKLPSTLSFLSTNNIIDYSLILAINREDPSAETLDGMPIKVGIVDFLREYGGLEMIEEVFKSISSTETTVTQTGMYAERMRASVTKYFCEVPS